MAGLVPDMVGNKPNSDANELCRAWKKVRDQTVLIFFDPGGKANFISPKLASKLGIRPEEMGHTAEARLACPGHSEAVTPIIGNYTYEHICHQQHLHLCQAVKWDLLFSPISASRSKYRHDRFPSRARTPEQQEERKRILEAATATLDRPIRRSSSSPGLSQQKMDPLERAAERERMVLDIKVKLQGLWQRLLVLGSTEDPLASSEYGTILALIESDAEGIGGSGFIECIGEHINSGWSCALTEEQFIAVKELIKTTVSLAISRNDMVTIHAALEFSAVVYRKDVGSVADYIQRHLGVLPIWDELRFWDGYFDCLMDSVANNSAYHPQTDCQTERVNQILEEMLRHYIQIRLASWEEYLPLVEFAYNNATHSVTSMTPFQAAYGHTRLVPTNFVLQYKVVLADQLVQEMQDILVQVRDKLVHVQQKYQKQATKHR
ncbi:hypothetical protein L7F22_006400 [Adiantum nelumboides]|nr:hypothetical protein [Adiantum nelumboides]